jgi:TonB family protein
VDEKGKLVSAEIAESSKFQLLDDAAVKVAKLGRYKAPTTEGKAVAGCANLPVKFELKKK